MTRALKIVNGDWVRNPTTARLETVEDEERARQAVRRLMALDAPFGADLDSIAGKVPEEDYFSFAADIDRKIRQAFETSKQRQRSRQRDRRTAAELLDKITYLQVAPAKVVSVGDNGQRVEGFNPTWFQAQLSVSTVAGTLASASQVIVPSGGG